MHETGIRIFLGYVAKMAAKFDKGIEPLAVMSRDHFYRVFLRVRNGAGRANNSLKNIGFVDDDFFVNGVIGPMWVGNMYSSDILNSLEIKQYFGSKDILSKMLDCWKYEDIMLLFYDSPFLAKHHKFKQQPSLDSVISTLQDDGYIAGRTHFSHTGIKTDASLDMVLSAYKKSLYAILE